MAGKAPGGHRRGVTCHGRPRTLPQSGLSFKKRQRNPPQDNPKFRPWITAARRASLRGEPRRTHRGLWSRRGGEGVSPASAKRETDAGDMESGFLSGARGILGTVSRNEEGAVRGDRSGGGRWTQGTELSAVAEQRGMDPGAAQVGRDSTSPGHAKGAAGLPSSGGSPARMRRVARVFL